MKVNPFFRRAVTFTVLVFPFLSSAQTWLQTTSSNTWTGIAVSADGSKLVATAGGQNAAAPIFVSTNYGQTWNPCGAPSNSWMSIASSADGSKLAAGTYAGAIYTSTDSGATWQSNRLYSQLRPWYSIASSADGLTLVAVSSTTQIFASTNRGASWITNSAPGTDSMYVTLSADGTRLALINNFGVVTTSTNYGHSWITTNVFSSPSTRPVVSSADGQQLLYVVGAPLGKGVYSCDGGYHWITNNMPFNFGWYDAALAADGRVQVAVTRQIGIYSSSDAGLTWVSNDVPALDWNCVASSADGSVLAATERKGGIWISHSMPTPEFNLGVSNSTLALTWIVPSTNFTVQQCLDLSSWSDVTNIPVLDLTNLQEEIVLPKPASNTFYRLKAQ